MTNADLNFANVFLNKKRLKNKKNVKNVKKRDQNKKNVKNVFTSLLHPFAVHLYCSIPPVTFE